MFKLFRKAAPEREEPPIQAPHPGAPASQTTFSARPEVRGTGAQEEGSRRRAGKSADAAVPAPRSAPPKGAKAVPAAPDAGSRAASGRGRPEPIMVRHTVPMRGRPEVLYRLALVPTRRAAWDSNVAESGWVDSEQTLKKGARAQFRLVRRLGGLKFEAEYGGLKTSKAGGWRSVRGVGPLEELSQDWTFRGVPGQPVTEVTLTLRGQVRFAWVRAQMERMLQNMLLSTLLDMQREVDAPTAGRIDEMTEAARRQAEEQRKAEKAARKAARRGPK